MGTQKADWHAAAWPVADNLTVRVAAKYQGRLAGLTNATAQPADAWYQRASSTIAMGAGLTTKSARDLGTWRHEFGHFLDHQIGKEFSGLSYRYRSSSADFTDAMEADAKTMLTRAKIGLRTTPKLAAARVSYLDSYRALDELMALDSTAAREAYLEAAAKKQGFTLEELRDGLAEQTNATLGTTNAGQARLARILKALENGDPQEFLRNVVEFDSAELGLIRGSELDANWRKGNMPSFSDLFGAATSNRMMPHGRGYYGHRDDYYAGSTKQFSPNFGARQTEVFANLTSISGQGDTVLWRITKRLAPNMTKIFEEILRDAIARP